MRSAPAPGEGDVADALPCQRATDHGVRPSVVGSTDGIHAGYDGVELLDATRTLRPYPASRTMRPSRSVADAARCKVGHGVLEIVRPWYRARSLGSSHEILMSETHRGMPLCALAWEIDEHIRLAAFSRRRSP
jgi:hypothetical protein